MNYNIFISFVDVIGLFWVFVLLCLIILIGKMIKDKKEYHTEMEIKVDRNFELLKKIYDIVFSSNSNKLDVFTSTKSKRKKDI